MATTSAGILVFRRGAYGLEVLLVHPGGPFWKGKDLGAWSIPKGLPDSGEDLLETARREFGEETGVACPTGKMVDLGEIKLASGKRVRAWAVEGDLPLAQCRSNRCRLEWPPKSGTFRDFPEVDQWRYFSEAEAKRKINQAQRPLIDRLLEQLKDETAPESARPA